MELERDQKQQKGDRGNGARERESKWNKREREWNKRERERLAQ